MIFDQFCGIVERHVPLLESFTRDAALFVFPGKAQEVLPKQMSTQIDFLRDMFFLPFDTIAIEDAAGCVFFRDMEPDQIGFDAKRQFIDIIPQCPKDPTAYREDEASIVSQMTGGTRHSDAYCITIGTIHDFRPHPDGKQFEFQGQIAQMMMISKKDGMVLHPHEISKMLAENPEYRDEFYKSGLRNAAVALQEIMYFNSPDRWIVQVESSKPKKNTGKKTPRSHARPQYTLLSPKEIHKMGQATGDIAEGTKAPHNRRRHPRTFHSERYKTMKDKTIIIAASWIGPSEFIQGKKRYKIRLDL